MDLDLMGSIGALWFLRRNQTIFSLSLSFHWNRLGSLFYLFAACSCYLITCWDISRGIDADLRAEVDNIFESFKIFNLNDFGGRIAGVSSFEGELSSHDGQEVYPDTVQMIVSFQAECTTEIRFQFTCRDHCTVDQLVNLWLNALFMSKGDFVFWNVVINDLDRIFIFGKKPIQPL